MVLKEDKFIFNVVKDIYSKHTNININIDTTNRTLPLEFDSPIISKSLCMLTCSTSAARSTNTCMMQKIHLLLKSYTPSKAAFRGRLELTLLATDCFRFF